MGVFQTLVRRARQFGLRRSAAVYLVIVIGLVLASELAIEHIIGQGEQSPEFAVTNALAIAALVGVFVFFLFQGAVEDRERASVALSNSEERFRSLTALSADWFWETDAEYRISWIAGSHSMLKLFGSELAYGRRFWEISGIRVRGTALEDHLAVLEARTAFHELELCRPGKDGASEYHLISGEPRCDAAGRFAGYRGVGRDVTASRRAEAALTGAKERLELALDSGAHAIWDSDLATGRIYLSEGWAHIVGKSSGAQWCVLADLAGLVHKQDLEAILLASRKAIKGETASFGAEIRLHTASGDWKWAMASGRVVERGPDGRALRMSGTVVDIDRGKRAEHALRDAEARYRTLVDLSPDGVLLQSDGLVEYANRAAADILGAPRPSALVGLDSMHLIHPEDRPAILERARYLRAGPGKSDFLERRLVRLDGGVVTVEGASVSYLERGRLVVQTVLRDISERVQGRQELAVREQRFRDVVEAAGEYVWETDAGFRYTWLSERVEAVLGHVHADLIGRQPQDFMPLGEARSVEERLLQASRNGAPFRDLVHRSVTKSGRAIWQSISGVPVFDRAGVLKGFRGTGSDITAKRQAEERIQYLATRDALTGLPNRVLLAERVGQAIDLAGRKRGRIALMSLNLDRFHLVNESLGHRAGDALLRAIAERLSNALGRDDTLARLGADEFALLWAAAPGNDDAGVVAQRALDCLARPVMVEGRSLRVSASVGISMYPGDGADFDELLKNAHAARDASREADGNTYRFFSRELNARALERLDGESALHRALERGEFMLHYQPVVRSRGALQPEVVGAKVLMRWNHPEKGVLLPGEFLPLAGQVGLMGALGHWMVESAASQVAAWRRGPAAGLWFALSVSAREFSPESAFPAVLRSALQRHGLEGSRIALEVSERYARLCGGDALQALKEVALLGVALTLEDFGSGPSSLAGLRQVPVSKLKVDRELVAELATHQDAVVVVRAMVAMARGLGLGIAADGVESEAQLIRLRELGCDEWQGTLYSAPIEAAAFERLIASQRHAASA